MPHFKINFRYSYTIAAILLALFESYRILQQQWSGDFWQHSAVVKELSENPAHPHNPVILSDAPHAFYSPYSLLVAVFSKLTGFDPILSLSCFGFLNMVFFLWSSWFFCRNVFKEHQQIVAALSLFLVLFFVGKEPLSWSGFYHFFFLQYALPYPSTFSMAVSFFVLGTLAGNQQRQRFWKRVQAALLTAIVFITHPTTGVFLSIAILSFHLSENDRRLKQAVVKSTLIIAPALLLAMMWPYYNFIDLLSGSNADFHRDSKVLYENIASHHWPALLSLPVLLLIKKDRLIFFFAIAIALMIALYALGYFIGSYGFGRLISNIVIFADFLIAYGVVQLFIYRKRAAKLLAATGVVCLIISIFMNRKEYRTSLSLSHRDISYYTRFHLLEKTVKRDDVVLTDLGTALYVPTFNGKVIANRYPLYWVSDIQDRKDDVRRFFSTGTSDSIRERIIDRYKPHYIVIDHRYFNPDSSFALWLEKNASKVAQEEKLELFKLRN